MGQRQFGPAEMAGQAREGGCDAAVVSERRIDALARARFRNGCLWMACYRQVLQASLHVSPASRCCDVHDNGVAGVVF